MSTRGIRRVLRIRFTRQHLEREVDDEIAFHVAQRAEQLRGAGMTPDEALAEAQRRFGNVAALRKECLREDSADLREDRLMRFFDHLHGDLRFALRSLKLAPGFTAVALTTLVVGIASVTTLFSILYAYAFRPLPYKDADRIVAIQERHPRGFMPMGTVSVEAARAIAAGSRSFERVTVFDETLTHAVLAGKPVDMRTLQIDSSFVAMFGIQPARGRVMTHDEIVANAPVAMISDVVWRTAFGADSTMVGRAVRLGDELITVVGVMPVGFRFPTHTDLWRPLNVVDTAETTLVLLGKLNSGAGAQKLAADLKAVARGLAQNDPRQFAGVTLSSTEMIDRGIGGAMPIASIFVGAAVFVLLIACSNVANLLLVRAAERRGEMAIRASLGAGKGRLIAQALTESIVLAILAGLGGTLLSMAFVKIFLAVIPTAGFPSWLSFEIDGGILLFTVGIVVLVTLAVGLTPARESVRFDLVRALKAGGDAGSGNSGVAKSARRGIVIQLALSVVLFVGAALLAQTYRQLAIVDVGYPAEEIVALQLYMDPQRLPTDSARMRFALDVFDRVRNLAGVRSSAVRGYADTRALAGTSPTALDSRALRNATPDTRLFADGDTTGDRAAGRSIWPSPRYFAVTDDYFHMLELPVIRGRPLSSGDVAGSKRVVVLSRRFADILWPRENPLGRVIQLGVRGTRMTVVGVVEDVRDIQGGRDGRLADRRADAYFSVRQVNAYQTAVLARGSGSVTGLQNAAQAAARRVDPEISTSAFTMAHAAETELMITKMLGSLIGAFAVCGLVLSVIGIYGVVAYGITQRTREIGIRLALGGTSRDVLQFILRDAFKFTAIGMIVGMLASLGTGRLLRVLLFGVSTTDAVTYAAVCLVFGGVAALACYVPARRVTRIDPLTALRAD